MIAVLAPGQGAQKPGMLAPWLELPSVAESIAAMSDAAGLDLESLGTSAGADDIKDTAVTQPLVVATSLLVAAVLDAAVGLPEGAPTAGHSVGELAAAAIAGVMDPVTAVGLAARRGRAMAECCRATPTSMAAVLGGETDDVLAALEARGLVGANVNGGGQIVAAGPVEALSALKDDPPGGASRVIPLSVAGAFHTGYMAAAETDLASAVNSVIPAEPTRPLLTNADGSVVGSGAAYLGLLVRQLTRPVRWDLCMAQLAALGVSGTVELAPAGTLTGLVKRALPDVATLAIKSPDDLDKAREFIAEHATASTKLPTGTPSDDRSDRQIR
ncbi:MAG: biotin attachment protein [Actinobacteria bacterium 69-20]|nr:ACP S-malonyltransferase [Actinomycetota bacterium]OJV30189.1 MAG: biotin attachment protein [Actinobacteria bacterium 69-20]